MELRERGLNRIMVGGAGEARCKREEDGFFVDDNTFIKYCLQKRTLIHEEYLHPLIFMWNQSNYSVAL